MALIQSIWLPRRGKKSTMNGTKKGQVLAKGEFFTEYPDSGVGTGHGKAKMGDGVTTYDKLPYFLGDTENEKITFSSNTSTTVAGALNAVVSGATLKNIIAGLKQAIVQNDANVTKLNDDFAKNDHTHDDRYYTETEIDGKIKTITDALNFKADILRENKTVYVSPSGVDSPDRNGSASQPWRSLQYAIDRAPHVKGNYEYTINVAAGSYAGFQASGTNIVLLLCGDITIDSSYNGGANAIDIASSTLAIRSDIQAVRKFIVNQNVGGGSGWYIHNNSAVSSYRIAFIVNGAGKSNGYGFELSSNSTLTAFGTVGGSTGRLKVVGKSVGVQCAMLSKIYTDLIEGTNCGIGLQAQSGSEISADTCTIAADTVKVADATSRVTIG